MTATLVLCLIGDLFAVLWQQNMVFRIFQNSSVEFFNRLGQLSALPLLVFNCPDAKANSLLKKALSEHCVEQVHLSSFGNPPQVIQVQKFVTVFVTILGR
jgi:hypothetical protein